MRARSSLARRGHRRSDATDTTDQDASSRRARESQLQVCEALAPHPFNAFSSVVPRLAGESAIAIPACRIASNMSRSLLLAAPSVPRPSAAPAARYPVTGAVPLANVNINILDQVTRVAQRVSHDNTDVNGNFTVYVNPGLYDIHFDPPACGGMAPDQLEGLSVSGPMVLPVESLVTGVHLLGSVTDPVSLPAVNVDLDVYPAGGVNKLYTPGDKSSATGAYDVLVRPGTYDVRYTPSSLTRMRPAFRTNIAMAGNVTVPAVVLAYGSDWFRTGGSDDGSGRFAVISVGLAFALWSLGLLAVMLPYYVAHPWFDSRWTNWIGLVTRKPATEDYVPLLPWLGLMWWGVASGRWLLAHQPGWLTATLPGPLHGLALLGQWSLSFYMLHQPVLIGLLMLVVALRGG